MAKEPYSWARLVRFYRRNDMLAWCGGIFVFGHLFWWQVQQNRGFVSTGERRRTLGPIPLPYLDELEFFKKSPPSNTSQSNKSKD